MSYLDQNRKAIYAVLLVATLVAVYAFYASLPRPEPIEIVPASPEPTAVAPVLAARITVHVVGAVQHPGVYELAADARIIDAVTAAGGLTVQADSEMINLADRVGDGQQVRVPAVGEQLLPSLTPLSAASGQRSGPGVDIVGPGAMLNINTASAAELETLPGIGPVLAERIVSYRQGHGPFAAVEDIMAVSGVGEGIFAQIHDSITVQ